MSTPRLRLSAALAACCLLAVTAPSCFSFPETSGAGAGGAGTGAGGAAATCNSDNDCDDQEACTTDTCGADKVCVHEAAPDGPAPDSAQKAGDCKTVVCEGGVAKSYPDDEDIRDDHNSCTIDACKGGNETHTQKPAQTMCEDELGHVGRCGAEGQCEIICFGMADCVPPSPCQTAECDFTVGACVFTPLADGTPTPGASQTPGDCKVHVCMGGMDVEVPDDSDVPVTASDCDQEVCNNGVPVNPGLPLHNPCSTYNGNQPGFCDGNGTCQECAEDSDCPGPTDDCKRPACDLTAWKCYQQNTPVDTPTLSTPPQILGDCQTLVCDGNGGTMNVYAMSDPMPDGITCTIDTCMAPSTTIHPNAPNGTACGVALACVNGACTGCTMDSQCAQDSCNGTILTKSQTCNLATNSCVSPSPATQDCAPYLCSTAGNGSCTTTCVNDAGCSQGGVGNWCNAGTCTAKLPPSAACGSPANGNRCQSGNCVDGVCCNTTCTGVCQACSAAKKGSGPDGQCGAVADGTDPDAECPDDGAATCDRDGSCNGAGACRLYPAGTVCAASSCMGGTLTKPKNCDGAGTCVTPNPATQSCAPYLCVGGVCTTTCTTDANCAAGNYCTGGMCVVKMTQGSPCTAPNQCQSGFCADGYCCNSACNTACQACAAALKNSGAGNGICGNALVGNADPRSLCGMSPPCGNTGLCATGGVCQKTASGTQCQAQSCTGSTLTTAKTCDGLGSCNVGGTTSACPGNLVCNVTMTACRVTCGTSDANCVSGYYCEGLTGTCLAKKASGQACSANNECLSGNCAANVCN